MPIDYVSSFTASVHSAETGGEKQSELLWGDRVSVEETGAQRSKVKARGKTGWVENADLGGRSLLEVYFIDVAQGDGVLIRTPDHRHILIDGGYNRAKQNSGRNAADFVDWKFHDDYGTTRITLDAMIASHCDQDHYGGLWDLLNPNEVDELDCTEIEVGAFYHAGVARWQKPGGSGWLGPKTGGYLTQLMGNRNAVTQALNGGAGPQLQGDWAGFMQTVVDQGCAIERISHATGYLPGFEPGPGRASILVLGPCEYELGGSPALKSLGGDSQNTNGNSILLRLEYGRTRILLTGDLNKKSQHALLAEYSDAVAEFQCDVAKGCHHGSEDVSLQFLEAMEAAVTVISSGDNESHSHPRPSIVAASALSGHREVQGDEVVTPLIYSTEISRSTRLGRPTHVRHTNLKDESGNELKIADLSHTKVGYEVTKSGDLHPTARERFLASKMIADGIVYGLVNVRTDGDRILSATLNEARPTWDVRVIRSRF